MSNSPVDRFEVRRTPLVGTYLIGVEPIPMPLQTLEEIWAQQERQRLWIVEAMQEKKEREKGKT